MSETKSTRKLRHQIDSLLFCAHKSMAGRPGLSKDEMIELIEHAQKHVAEVVPLLAELREITETRDLEAHRAAKAEKAEKEGAKFADEVLGDIAKLLTIEHPTEDKEDGEK
jgi:hypothetical protein